MLGLNVPESSLWEIEFRCDHDNCGRQRTIWLAYSTEQIAHAKTLSESELRALLSVTNVVVPCQSHDVLLREQEVRLKRHPKN